MIATIGQMADIILLIIEAAQRIAIVLFMAMATIMVKMISTGIWMTVTQMISAGIYMITCSQRTGLRLHPH